MIADAPAREADPGWLTTLIHDYQSAVANTFLVHGNVFDYVDHPDRDQVVREYLAGRLAKNFSVVMYSPDEGVTFPGEQSTLADVRAMAAETRARFEKVSGLGASELDEAERLLQQAGQGVGGQTDIPREPERALPVLVDFLAMANGADTEKGGDGSGKRAVVIVDRLDLIAPPCDKGTAPGSRLAMLGLLHRVGTLRDLNALGNLLVLLAPSLEEVHPDLRAIASGIRALEVPPPDYEARLDFLGRIVARKKLSLDGIGLNELAAQMAGLGLRHIEDVALRAARRTDWPGIIDRRLVRDRKKELLAAEYGGVIEVVEPSVTLDMIGGHQDVKAWLDDWVFGPAESGDPGDLQYMPLGCLLMGPAGTGKTILGQAIADRLGWNFLFIRPENIKGSLVGESQQKQAKAIRGAEAMAPCVVMFDEVDQKIRRGEGGSGGGGDAVENDAFARWLEWMSDTTHRGRILMLAATNRPDILDAAFKRRGRFDGKLPLLPPDTARERLSVLSAAINRHCNGGLGTLEDADVVTRIGREAESWTQAELEGLVLMAKGLAKIKRTSLDQGLLLAKDRMRTATSDVQRMTLLALAECDDMTLVPERYRPLLAQMQAAEDAQAAAPRRPAPGPREGRDLAV
jgi:transitional endoplasmic reticulum ATPase